ncbi:MAG: MFS transporter, partial [Planctomycetota bacterium]
RFDRRSALLVALSGLVVAIASGAFATDFDSLVFARVLAGMFGGPATAIGLSMVADVVPPERRGRAMGIVMSAFSVASVLGLPIGLECARVFGWWTPFVGVASLGALIAVAILFMMPSLTLHLQRAASLPPEKRGPAAVLRAMWRLATTRAGALTLTSMFVAMFAAFMIIPNISTFIQFNGHYPRADLGLLYLAGGGVSLAAMNRGGRLVDQFGSVPVAAFGTVLAAITLGLGFAPGYPLIPVYVVFMLFMGAQSLRAVAMNSLGSRVPRAHERARYQALQAAVTHAACAAGAMTSTVFLVELPDGSLDGMTGLTILAMMMFLSLPFLLMPVERIVRREEAENPEYRTYGPSFAQPAGPVPAAPIPLATSQPAGVGSAGVAATAGPRSSSPD